MRTHRVVIVPGDGIGPELVEAAMEVLEALEGLRGDFHLEPEYHQAGARYYQQAGENISRETLAACRAADAIMKGPAGLPDVRLPDGTEAGSLGSVLRVGLDLYANIRPMRLLPGVTSPLKAPPGAIDYVIVREATEGLYISRGLGVGNEQAMVDTMLITRVGVERIARVAFERALQRNGAPRDGVRRVTCVDKSNVLRSFSFFRRIFQQIGEQYPDVEKDYLYSDTTAQALIMQPDRFDILVMENFLGDLFSDLGAATVGGLGMCPSGLYGEKLACFEPIHGTAPSLAGQGLANPISQIRSAAMMLAYLGEEAAAQQLEQAVWQTLASGRLTIDALGRPVGGTQVATEAIIEALPKAAEAKAS